MHLRSIFLSVLIGIVSPVVCSFGQTINWSGYTWNVRNDTGGPGPNTFLPANVSVDANGALHLTITKVDGQWTCGEVYSTQSFGFGTYQFDVTSRVDQLDPNVVLGLFSYPDNSPDGTDELDIEYSRWGVATNDNLSFTAYPATLQQKSVSKGFAVHPLIPASINRYVWSKRSIHFHCLTDPPKGAGKMLAQWQTPTSFAKSVGQNPMPVHLNLWLFQSAAPSDQNQVEVVIRRFQFKAEK